ncbi:hypothetical protein [Moorena sp. SIO2C4]|uniref:hypothetical protein n=1 Tax=Moorena sp. SIO2C4 TaxID=2607824 RepID=UPI00257C8275|nr:hypothetical protein [Moorena sp. SIO2C4]
MLLLCAVAAFDQAGMASAILGTVAVLLLLANFQDCATAKASYLYVLRQLEGINLESATNNPTNSQQNKQAAIIGVEL